MTQDTLTNTCTTPYKRWFKTFDAAQRFAHNSQFILEAYECTGHFHVCTWNANTDSRERHRLNEAHLLGEHNTFWRAGCQLCIKRAGDVGISTVAAFKKECERQRKRVGDATVSNHAGNRTVYNSRPLRPSRQISSKRRRAYRDAHEAGIHKDNPVTKCPRCIRESND